MDEGPPMFAPLGWLKGPGAKRIYRTVAASALFDPTWYRHTHMATADLLRDPLWHYLDRGWKKGCDPSPFFDGSHYALANRDVRNSGLNPLFHYLEYGQEERRSPLASVLQTFRSLVPDAQRLRVFISPRVGDPRLTVVVDSATAGRKDTSLLALLHSVMALAKKDDRVVRIISFLPSHSDLTALMMEAATSASILSDRVECVPAHRTDIGPTFGIHEDEIFLSTSWTSARSLAHVAPESRVWCHAPEAVSGSQEAIVSQTHSLCQTWAVVAEAESFRGGQPALATAAWGVSHRRVGKIHVGVYANATVHPMAYVAALQLLEEAVFRNPDLLEKLEVTVFGDGVKPLAIAEELTPHIHTPRATQHALELDVVLLAVSDDPFDALCASQGITMLDTVVHATEGARTAAGPESLLQALTDAEISRRGGQ